MKKRLSDCRLDFLDPSGDLLVGFVGLVGIVEFENFADKRRARILRRVRNRLGRDTERVGEALGIAKPAEPDAVRTTR